MSADSDPTPTTSRPKYHAVITYVPEEFIWCDWLHRQLDGTTVPADLANKRTRHGFPRPPLIHVFPDPRNPAHLARHATAPPPSRHLIVICSPHSAAAPALEEQIRAFKRTEGEDRIVVLVVDGDPEHDTAPVGHDDAAWLPAWLRWRLDKKGNFRPAEASEPQIIDARADRVAPPEARAQLLAALLDVPRESLRAYGDLVSASSSETLVAAAAVDEPAAASAPKKGGPAGLVVIGLIIAAAAGAYWWSNQSGRETSSTATAETSPPAATPPEATPKAVVASTPAPTPTPTAAPTPTPTPKPATPKPATPPPSTPAPATPTPAPKPPATPIATPAVSAPVAKKATPKPAAPPKKVVAAFAPSEGPQTPVTSISEVQSPAAPAEPGSSWQRMRDLGDTLMTRDNRDTGIIALTQASEIGLRTAAARGTTVEERIEIGRLCFRVAALQKQFMNPKDARRTLEASRGMLQGLHLSGAEEGERDRLVADIDQLLGSISR